MFDSGLVRGVTLFLLIKVPGPLFTSWGVIQIIQTTFRLRNQLYPGDKGSDIDFGSVRDEQKIPSLSSITSGRSLWVFTASTFREMDSTLHP